MSQFSRVKNKIITLVASKVPFIREKLIAGYQPVETCGGIPWVPIERPLDQLKIAMVSTSGIHHTDQKPFDMSDSNGDPTYRVIDGKKIASAYTITHDYYNHSSADKDVNCVFPIDHLMSMAKAGIIGSVADHHYSFMGHIDGPHIDALKNKSGKEVAMRIKKEGVDAVLLVPS